MHEEMLTYGLKKGTMNELLYIDSEDVPNGLNCGCVCPHCKHPLVARNGGTKRTHHFAHYMGAECGKARMTALHLLAQHILAREKKVMLPDYHGDYYQANTESIEFDEVKLEETLQVNEEKKLRPDCIGVKYDDNNNAHQLWIEIYVTHEVKGEKEKYINESANACIEIDLSDLLDTDYSEESILKRLQEFKDDRKWICCPKFDKKNEKLRAEAKQKDREEQKKRAEERMLRREKLRERQNVVELWFNGELPDITETIIHEIEECPYPDSADYDFGDYKSLMPNLIFPDFDFLEYIRKSPKNNNGLRVFYELLRYYYNKVPNTDYQNIKQRLDSFRYRKDLTMESRIELEELVSLKMIYILEHNRRRFYEVDFEDKFKTLIKKYIKDYKLRLAVLMVASIFYHHVLGSSAHNFGELTQEIILHQPSLARIYLKAINSQEKYKNDYRIGAHDMLVDLQQFVDTHNVKEDEYVSNIIKVCYNFAFDEIRPESHRKQSRLPGIESKEQEETIQAVYVDTYFQPISQINSLEEIAKAANKWYQES